MTVLDVLKGTLLYSMFLPAGAMCLFPMRNKARFTTRRIALHYVVTIIPALLVASYFNQRFNLGANDLIVYVIAVLYAVYHWNVKVTAAKSMSIFLAVGALLTILSNLASLVDARFHPMSGADTLDLSDSVIQFILLCLAALLLWRPLWTKGSFLIDNLNQDQVWFATLPFTLILVIINMVIRPTDYAELMESNRMTIFSISLAGMLLSLLLLAWMFSSIVTGLLRAAQINERNRMLEVQESQYARLRKYIDDSAAFRHDFKQTIRTMAELSRNGDHEALDRYLKQYVESMPENDSVTYCKNNAVNALLNYYHLIAEQRNIDLLWKIVLPDALPFSDVDLCGMIGNILDNAVSACETLKDEPRWIHLNISTQGDSNLCIAATNSFDGKVRMRRNRYLSTRSTGTGTGLMSITSTAERYGGTASFYHREKTFYTDVMLPLSQPDAK